MKIIAKTFLLIFILTLSMPAFAQDKTNETAFERIIRTGVIRCGYYVFPPTTYRDPNTNELSGFTVDYMNRIAERAALKVEWTKEVTWGNWIPEIEAGRFDVACTPMWPELTMLKAVTFTDPIFFAGLYPLVRKDDLRFESAGLDRLNEADVTFVVQEGNSVYSVTQNAFPKAKIFALPPTASGGEYYQALIAKKADAALTDRNGLYLYEKNNGNNFKLIAESQPIKIQSSPMAVARGENDLLLFLNQSIREMAYSGDTDQLLRKWEPQPGITFLRSGKPYEASQ